MSEAITTVPTDDVDDLPWWAGVDDPSVSRLYNGLAQWICGDLVTYSDYAEWVRLTRHEWYTANGQQTPGFFPSGSWSEYAQLARQGACYNKARNATARQVALPIGIIGVLIVGSVWALTRMMR